MLTPTPGEAVPVRSEEPAPLVPMVAVTPPLKIGVTVVLVPVVIVRAVGVRLLATGIATTVVVVVAVLLGSSTLVAVMV